MSDKVRDVDPFGHGPRESLSFVRALYALAKVVRFMKLSAGTPFQTVETRVCRGVQAATGGLSTIQRVISS